MDCSVLGIGIPKRKFNALNPVSVTLDNSLVGGFSGKAMREAATHLQTECGILEQIGGKCPGLHGID